MSAGRKEVGQSGKGAVLSALILIAMLFALLMAFALPAFVVLTVGILPTVAAAFIDRTPGLQATRCIGAANMAGVLPMLAMAFEGSNSLATASNVLGDLINWLIMYLAAGFGWLLLWIAPVGAEVAISHAAKIELKSLQDGQNKLVADWGRKLLGK